MSLLAKLQEKYGNDYNIIEYDNSIVLKVGEMIVFRNVKTEQECVFYINNDFPLSGFRQMVSDGIFIIRRPTQEEKEFCYWIFQETCKEGVDLAAIDNWRDYKSKIL